MGNLDVVAMGGAYHVIHDPVRAHRERCPLGSERDMVDLGRIEPGHAQNPRAERGEEDEEGRRGESAHGVGVCLAGLGKTEGDTDGGPARRASKGRNHHDPTTAEPLNQEPCQEAEDQVVDGTGSGENAGSV